MITDVQYKNLSNHLKAEEAAIKAVTRVESKGNGFLSNGYPKILFEGHIFWRQLVRQGIDPSKNVKGNEDILYHQWTKKFYRGGISEYERLNRAKKIHESAALQSASYGAFQIMGFHYKTAGFSTVQEFVESQKTIEGQVTAFLSFIKGNPNMLKALRSKNWDVFARLYNGSGYKENRYDAQLKKAYESFRPSEILDFSNDPILINI